MIVNLMLWNLPTGDTLVGDREIRYYHVQQCERDWNVNLNVVDLRGEDLNLGRDWMDNSVQS